MAYQVTANNQSISATSAPVTDYPFTLHAVIKTNSNTKYMTALYIANTSETNYVGMQASGVTAGDPFSFYAVAGGFSSAYSTSAFSIADWNYAAGVGTSAASRTIYLNGGNSATNTDSRSPSSWSKIVLMNPESGVTGEGAEIAVWNVALTAAEITSLSKGFKPYRIRPQSLKYYAPLVRNLIEVKVGLTLTNNNSCTVADHPRVY